MSRKDDHMMGITPITLRRAGYYLSLGTGVYYPDHPHFDQVVVEQTYPVTQHPEVSAEWSQGMQINFYKDGRRVRWVEFGCRLVGAGGDAILHEVIDND